MEPNIDSLPNELVVDVLTWVPIEDLYRNCRLINRFFRDVVDNHFDKELLVTGRHPNQRLVTETSDRKVLRKYVDATGMQWGPCEDRNRDRYGVSWTYRHGTRFLKEIHEYLIADDGEGCCLVSIFSESGEQDYGLIVSKSLYPNATYAYYERNYDSFVWSETVLNNGWKHSVFRFGPIEFRTADYGIEILYDEGSVFVGKVCRRQEAGVGIEIFDSSGTAKNVNGLTLATFGLRVCFKASVGEDGVLESLLLDFLYDVESVTEDKIEAYFSVERSYVSLDGVSVLNFLL